MDADHHPIVAARADFADGELAARIVAADEGPQIAPQRKSTRTSISDFDVSLTIRKVRPGESV